MINFLIEKRQVALVKLLKIRWANKLKNLMNQESILFKISNISTSHDDLIFQISLHTFEKFTNKAKWSSSNLTQKLEFFFQTFLQQTLLVDFVIEV